MKEEDRAEAVSLAGKVLSKGNPFDEASGLCDIASALNISPEAPEIEALADFFEPYFEASLSLAGHILGDAPDRGPPVSLAAPDGLDMESIEAGVFVATAATALADPLELSSAATELDKLTVREGMLALLKGMHPAGTTWAHLAVAVNASAEAATPVARELVAEHLVRQEDATVYASLDVMADEGVKALPWPSERTIR